MKCKKKRIGRTVIAGLMTLTLTCSAAMSGVGVAQAAPEEATGESYTWHRLESLKQLESIFAEKGSPYQVANSFDDKSSIPILIVGTDSKTGAKYVFNEGAEKGHDLDTYGTSWWYHRSNRPSAKGYPVSATKDLPGFSYSETSDTIITKGIDPFFIENKPYEQNVYPKNRKREYAYEIHACAKTEGGEAIPSGKMLRIAATNDESDLEYWCSFPLLKFGEVSRVPLYEEKTHWAHAWNLEEVKNGNRTRFKITNFYYGHRIDVSVHSLVEMKAVLSYHQDEKMWLAHAGVYARHRSVSGRKENDYDFGGDWMHVGNDKTDDGYVDALEIWYGVKGIEKSKLKTVDADGYFSEAERNATGMVTMSEIGGEVIGKGKVMSLPVLSLTHLAKGKTLLIEEGGTLILSRNAFLFNDGRIENHGTIIVQPGAGLGVYTDLQYKDKSYDVSGGDGAIVGGGEMLIRLGGKVIQWYVQQKKVESSGLLYTGKGFDIPKYKKSKNAAAYIGTDGNYLVSVDIIEQNAKDIIACLKLKRCSEYN